MPPTVEVLLLDLDDTLYPPETGLWPAIGERINRYMSERVGISVKDVSSLRMHYFQEYGTTLNGLRLQHGVDPQDYLEFVHDLPLAQYLKRDEMLRDRLLACTQRKWVFSNADRAHIERVLSVLGIRDAFEGIVDIYATEFACKPYPDGYRKAIQLAGASSPQACMMVDDQIRNLEPASHLGITPVLVHTRNTSAVIRHRIDSIYALPTLLQQHFSD
jgi:putative hydrolase of the HAD superfamily